MNKQYDNRALEIPEYTDEQLRKLPQLFFPYSDEYMVYDKRTHQYFLTNKALIEYGIEIDQNDNPNELNAFLRSVTTAVYSAIKVKAGNLNYPKMMYRIAKGLGAPNLSPLDFRNAFLFDVMLIQARYMVGGNAKDNAKVIMTNEAGRMKANDLNVDDLYWLHDDVIIALKSLNLLNPQRIIDHYSIDWASY